MDETQKNMIKFRDDLNANCIKNHGIMDITPYAKTVCGHCPYKHKGLDEDGSHMTVFNPFSMAWEPSYYCTNPFCNKNPNDKGPKSIS